MVLPVWMRQLTHQSLSSGHLDMLKTVVLILRYRTFGEHLHLSQVVIGMARFKAYVHQVHGS
jgi:hypothetical protein